MTLAQLLIPLAILFSITLVVFGLSGYALSGSYTVAHTRTI